jgi:uncharacterized membrane protein
MDASSARLADSEVWQTSEKALSCTLILFKIFFFKKQKKEKTKKKKKQRKNKKQKNTDAHNLSAKLFFFSFHGCLVCSPCRLRGLADLRGSAFLYYNPI